MSNELLYEPKKRELVPGGKYYFDVSNVDVVGNPYADLAKGDNPRQIRLTLLLGDVQTHEPVLDKDGTHHAHLVYMGFALGYTKENKPYKTQAISEAIMRQRLDPRQPFDYGNLLHGKGYINILGTEKDGVTPANRTDTIMPFGPIKQEFFNVAPPPPPQEVEDLPFDDGPEDTGELFDQQPAAPVAARRG
jgi:hypothetical protein